VSSEKTCTLAIIKPDAVVHGKTDEIIVKVREKILTWTTAPWPLWWVNRVGHLGSTILLEKEGF
jgi:hypothetical protein